jgi:hypothetical protein
VIRKAANWRSRLQDYIDDTKRVPFSWDAQNCGLWAAGAVEAMADRVLFDDYRAQCRTARGALVLHSEGLESLVDRHLERLDWGDIPECGDIVLASNGGSPCLTVCIGHALAAPGPHGLLNLDLNQTLAVWRF